jgi:hypothetical protein
MTPVSWDFWAPELWILNNHLQLITGTPVSMDLKSIYVDFCGIMCIYMDLD